MIDLTEVDYWELLKEAARRTLLDEVIDPLQTLTEDMEDAFNEVRGDSNETLQS